MQIFYKLLMNIILISYQPLTNFLRASCELWQTSSDLPMNLLQISHEPFTNFIWTYKLLMNLQSSYELTNFFWTAYKLFMNFLWTSYKLFINLKKLVCKNLVKVHEKLVKFYNKFLKSLYELSRSICYKCYNRFGRYSYALGRAATIVWAFIKCFTVIKYSSLLFKCEIE